jgi:tetratricopeptide (TPR) repeat protein
MPKEKKHKSKKQLSSSQKDAPIIYLFEYDITFDPIKTDYPPEVKKNIQKLYRELHINPKEAIPKLLVLKDKYPLVPILYNYLSNGYSLLGDRKMSEYWIKESYRVNPDYLFARLNLACLYLRDGRIDKVEELLEGKMDLQMHYPNRKTFHISEARAFYLLVAELYFRQGKVEAARTLYHFLAKLEPHHPLVLRLKNVLEGKET